MYFPYFITTCISPWKKTWSFILTNLNTLCPMMVCAKCCGHWLSGALIVLEKKVFEKTLINVFSFTGYCLPLEIVLSFILTNLNPLLQGMLDAIEIGPWVLEKKIKLWQVYRETDKGWSEKKISWAFSQVNFKRGPMSRYMVVRWEEERKAIVLNGLECRAIWSLG